MRSRPVSDPAASTRVAAAYELGERTMLRAAWGRYQQAQGVHELQVQDGESGFLVSTVEACARRSSGRPAGRR